MSDASIKKYKIIMLCNKKTIVLCCKIMLLFLTISFD